MIMKYDNKTFQQRYEAWKNGADYWKDIRGINLGRQAQEEPSEEEQKKLDNQVTNILAEYNRGKGNQVSVSPQQVYWNHMMKAGVDPIVAAGIAGNIQQESSFNHRASNGTHWGLVQTDKNLTDYIKKAYGDFSRDSQMNFISDMAMGTPRQIKHKMYNEVLSRSKAFRGEKYKTAQDAAKGWEIYFERSGGSGVGKRQKYASNIYNKYYHPIPTAAQLAEQNMQASPIIQNTPSIEQPQTINAAIPRTLLGPTTNNNIDARNLMHHKMYEEITTPTLPNVLNLLPTNNFGKDAYGQKFWWRRGNNLHFKSGKDERSFNDWANKASAYKGIKIKGDPTYDYKGWYNEDPNRAYALLNDDPSAHFSDKYKTPYHPTFSDQSVYSNAKHPGGTWGRRDFRDIYYAPFTSNVPFGRRLNYIIDAEDNGAMIANNAGMIPKVKDVYWGENGQHGYDLALDPNGAFYGGALPAVKVTGKRGKK